ncbi:MAG: response regulator transcription factor [Pseudomonadota bacterium]
MGKILLVEDELTHQMIIKKALEVSWQVELAGSFAEARQKLNEQAYDLFLLDIMLEDGLGYNLVEDIKGKEVHRNTPIVFLTSSENVDMKVRCFSLGADDYVVKPCDPRELRARIHAKMQKSEESGVATEYKSLGFEFRLGEQQAFYTVSGELVALDLTPIEYRMLFSLVRQGGNPLSREEILSRVWGDSHHVQARSVDTYVAAVRKKIKDYGVNIKSVHGVGYKITLPQTSNQVA